MAYHGFINSKHAIKYIDGCKQRKSRAVRLYSKSQLWELYREMIDESLQVTE